MRIAVSSVRTTIGLPAAASAPSPASKPAEHRLDHFFERRPALCVQFGGKTHLGVDDPVVSPGPRRTRPRRVRARRGSASRRRCGRSPPGSARGRAWARPTTNQAASSSGSVVGRSAIALLGGELDDRDRAEAAVEVVVEEHLRGAADLLERGSCRSYDQLQHAEARAGGGSSPMDDAPSSGLACPVEALGLVGVKLQQRLALRSRRSPGLARHTTPADGADGVLLASPPCSEPPRRDPDGAGVEALHDAGAVGGHGLDVARAGQRRRRGRLPGLRPSPGSARGRSRRGAQRRDRPGSRPARASRVRARA